MRLDGSASLFYGLRAFASSKPDQFFGGMEIRESSVFPFVCRCDKCEGTGSGGEQSTYCPKCKGQGETKIIGIVANGPQTLVINEPLPKRFPIRFPVPVPLREIRRCSP